MGFKKPKTRATTTEREYVKRAITMLKRFTLATGVEVRNNHQCGNEIEKHLKHVVYEEAYLPSTIRKHKASLHYYFKTNGFDILQKVIEEIVLISPEKTNKKRTSAKKYKCLPEGEYIKLTAKINRSKGQYEQLILTWIEATRITGIRPKEWIQSVMITKEHEGRQFKILKVMNAKNSNGRTFGKFRHIVLMDLTDHEMFNITTMMTYVETIQKEEGTLEKSQVAWDKIYQACRRRLHYLDTKARPNSKKTITFYSARQQFSADLKANEIDEYEIAALMGHASIITADTNYGKKHHGKKGPFRVRPLRDDVLRVIELNKHNVKKKIKKEQFLTSKIEAKQVQKHER